jgi:hypothetical protein
MQPKEKHRQTQDSRFAYAIDLPAADDRTRKFMYKQIDARRSIPDLEKVFGYSVDIEKSPGRK